MRPDSGEVLYDGRDLTSMGKHELNMLRREMGMLFQGSALFDSMTVLENVMFPLDMFSNDTHKDRLKRAPVLLGSCQSVGSRPSLSVRDQRRYDETCSHCPGDRLEPKISVL